MPSFRSLRFSLFAVLAVSMVLLFAAPSAAQQEQSYSPVASARATAKANVAANYGRIPLSFEANRGQTDRSVQFLSRGQGYTLLLRPGEALLALRSGNRTAAKKESPAGTSLSNQPGRSMPKSNENQISLVRMSLVGANAHAAAHEEDEQVTKTNYFIGNDPAKWRMDIPNYGRVRYAGIYPGIDLVYYGNQSRLEHDFVVAPGADPTRIRLAFNGAKRTRIDRASGDLILRTREGEIRLLKPVSYQESDGHRAAVSSSYKLFSDNRIGFHVAGYNHAQPLVIDPILVYSTYLGGSGLASNGPYSSAAGDQGNGIAVDSSGDAYIVGTTYSANFPVTAGSIQAQNYAVQTDRSSTVFMSELNPAGTALVSSTFLGGTNSDYGYAVALDASNNIYVAGVTHSIDFPITCGAFQQSNPTTGTSAPSGFIAKLGPQGNTLVYSTYLGAEGGVVPQAIVIDSSGDAFATGYTWSAAFPTTDGAFQSSFAGSSSIPNAFLIELNPGGASLVYSTYLGGSGSKQAGDYGNAIVLDSAGDAYVAGSTASSNFPVTKGALQTSLLGPTNAFVTEINPGGTDEVYSTYLGGSGGDSAQAIAIDGNGTIYVAGNTNSGDFPLTEGVLEGNSSGIAKYVAAYGQFGFAAKLNLTASTLLYSTYVEGQGTTVTGLAVDGSGNTYLTGTAPVPSAGVPGGFQPTPDALAGPANQGNSPFLVKLNSSASMLDYATFFGGSGSDNPIAIAVDSSGNVYLTGSTDSANFPISSGALQTANNAAAANAGNAFVAKFALAAEVNDTTYLSVQTTISTSISNVSAEFTGNYNDGFELLLSFNLDTGTSGPPPTGSITINCGGCEFINQCTLCGNGIFGPVGVTGSWGNTTPSGLGTSWIYNGPTNFQIIYSGDAIYEPVTSSVSNYSVVCSSDNGTCYGYSAKPKAPRSESASSRSFAASVRLPKFTPPPARPQREADPRGKNPLTGSQAESSCLVTHAVDIFMQNAARDYGAPNPPFGYQLTGVPSGYTIDVNSFSPATPSSPVGSYPITATVTAPPYDSFHVYNAMLQVNPAILRVTPRDAYQLGGVPRKPFSYVLLGLVNGDTASAAHGAPVFTTAAPAVPTPGAYPILATPGTLTAQNYSFVRGRGELNVFRPLALGAAFEPLFNDLYSVAFHVSQGPAGTVCGGVASQAGQIQGLFQFAQSAPPSPGARYKGAITFWAYDPGLYLGAMQIYGNCTPANLPSNLNPNTSAELLFSVPIYGDNLVPLSVFEPGTQAIVQPRGAAKLESPQAVAIDGNGALYIADAANNRIVQVSGASKTILNFGTIKLKAPSALAVDGAGNLDIADTGNDQVVQWTTSGQERVVSLGTRTLASPRGLVVDRLGDLLIADTGHNRIVLAKANGLVSAFATGRLRLSHPNGLAVDAAGDLFIADTGNNRIVKITSTGAAFVVPVGPPALKSPTGLALDAAGSLYITQKGSNKLSEVSLSGVQSELPSNSLLNPGGVAVDHNGVVYIADTGNKRILELQRDEAPTLRFGATKEGKVDAGGPQAIKTRSIGNLPLKISSFIFPPDFPEDPSASATECKAGERLAESASCTVTIDFKPVSAVNKGTEQLLKETVVIVSNTGGYTTYQYIPVEGTEVK